MLEFYSPRSRRQPARSSSQVVRYRLPESNNPEKSCHDNWWGWVATCPGRADWLLCRIRRPWVARRTCCGRNGYTRRRLCNRTRWDVGLNHWWRFWLSSQRGLFSRRYRGKFGWCDRRSFGWKRSGCRCCCCCCCYFLLLDVLFFFNAVSWSGLTEQTKWE